jgi:hypothetical protein
MANSERGYDIAPPVEHSTLSFIAPKEKVSADKQLISAKFQVRAAGVEKRALWVVHGMGQQVPFETLDALAQGVLLGAKAGLNDWRVQGHPRCVNVKFSSADSPSMTQVVQRVEIDLHKPGEPGARMELHLYEAYWAPLTEGVAKVTDVVSFLYNGALHGLLNCFRPFRRAMFPHDKSPEKNPNQAEGKVSQGLWDFRVRKIAAFLIVAALAIVLALGAINAAIVAASAAKLKFPLFDSWPMSGYWDQLTAIASAVTALALSFGLVLFLAEMSRPADLSSGAKRTIMVLSWVSLGIAAASIVLGGLLLWLIPFWAAVARWFQGMHYYAAQFVATVGILFAILLAAIAALRRAAYKSKGKDHRHGGVPFVLFLFGYLLHILILILLISVQFHRFLDLSVLSPTQQKIVHFLASPYWVWPALLAISKLLNDVIVEYPGDVAIYVAPNKLDRFDEARQEIKQLALDSLMPLYSARGLNAAGEEDPAIQLYSKVGLLGHSLGSVIAYDTLNKLLTLDELLNNKFAVAERTCVFETFGSPLDKTAFFFSYQGTQNLDIREQLAATVQPLIQDYSRFRSFPWINVYSRSDIISGNLKFYDVDPADPKSPHAASFVHNVADSDAVVPLVAHVEYWKNHTVWNSFFYKITA